MKRFYKRVNLGYVGESKNPVKTTAAKGGESKLVSQKVRESLNGYRSRYKYIYNPSLPKSPKYLVTRCLEPLKAFSGGVCGSKHLLTRYLED